jgi:hypothetical protein
VDRPAGLQLERIVVEREFLVRVLVERVELERIVVERELLVSIVVECLLMVRRELG